MTKAVPPTNIVLYADDDLDDLLLVQEALTSYSAQVEVVTQCDGMQALDYLENLPLSVTPCLIILDINMPRMNGKDALVHIRKLERFAAVPIILFSTSSMMQDKEFAAWHKARFITKPINAMQMEKIADRFIEHCTAEVKKKLEKRIE